jgi:cobyrinic acid a,c-diamide synthase
MPVVGCLPAEDSLTIPERHLGLVTAQEVRLQKRFIERMAALFERSLDLDLLLRISSPLQKRHMHALRGYDMAPRMIQLVRIGLASDRAFSFYYQDNLDMLRQMGATLVPFSPLRDRALPARLDGIYIGGGYPEVFAPDLEANRTMRREIKRFAEEGGVIYAECGGLMYLGKGIRTFSGRMYKMAGIFPYTTIMHRRLTRLGYHIVRALRDTIIARRGECARGHQFRYSSLAGDGPLKGDAFSVTKGAGGRAERDGFRYKNVLAQYVHIHFGSNRSCAQRLVESCHQRAGAARWNIG